MATAAQVANDLDAHAKALAGRYLHNEEPGSISRSLKRGAATIRELQARIEVLEQRPLVDCKGFIP